LRLLRQFLLTVQADATLHVSQDRAVHVETDPLLPEQECPKIGDTAELVGVELLDEPDPGSLDQITEQSVKGPQAVGHPRLQGDVAATFQILVEEVQALLSHGL